MKASIGILAAALLLAVPGWAQTPAPGTQPKTPAPAPGAKQPGPGAAGQDAPPTLEKPDPAKEAAIRHLMDITQTSKLGNTINNAITQQVRGVMSRAITQPDQLQKFMDAFSEKFLAAAPPSAVTDAEVPVYAHYFSMEDIEGLIKFYESPLGQRVVKNLPEVVQNTQQAGVQMDQKAALDVLRAMSTDYPQLKQMLPPEPGAPPPSSISPVPGTAPDNAPPRAPAPAPGGIAPPK
jgi:hypothetical protein